MDVRSAEHNFAVHLSYLARASGMTVRDEEDVLIVDSGLPSDTFNVVARAQFSGEERARQVVAGFDGRPFSWWVGASSPPELPRALEAAGLRSAEREREMALPLSQLVETAPTLEVRRVRTPSELADFAAVNAANWQPPDAAVVGFYERVAAAALAPECPARFYVGYLDGEPVASSEGCFAHGVVGIYAVATRREFRRRGYGTALTLAPLGEARREGWATATLQASAEGAPLYARLGFVPGAELREFRPA